MSEAVLATQSVRKSFGSLEVARDVSIELPRGARHALIGPNGAGKTTLIGIVTSLVNKTSGRVSVFGYDIDFVPMPGTFGSGLEGFR